MEQKFEYHFETIKVNWNNIKDPVYGMLFETSEYKEMIITMSKHGWRYVGYIPTKQRSAGFIEEMDLIFEKEINPADR